MAGIFSDMNFSTSDTASLHELLTTKKSLSRHLADNDPIITHVQTLILIDSAMAAEYQTE